MIYIEKEIFDKIYQMSKANLLPTLLLVNWDTYNYLRAYSEHFRVSQGIVQQEYFGSLLLRFKPNLTCDFLVI